MAQSNCGRGGRMAPLGSNKRMGAKAGFVPRFCHHDTRGPPSIFLAQKTGTLADFPIRHRGRAYTPCWWLNVYGVGSGQHWLPGLGGTTPLSSISPLFFTTSAACGLKITLL